MDITIRPMARAERNYCFSWGTHLMAAAGCIGHLRGDMGSEGKSFYTTWFDHQEDLKTQAFKDELDTVVNALRFDPAYGGALASRGKLTAYCYARPESAMGTITREYGFRVDTENYAYMLRLCSDWGDYNFYIYCYVRESLDYISQTEREFISRGYASEGLYSLRFSYVLTEAQEAENRAYAEAVGVGSDAWDTRITASARQHSGHMERVAAVLARNFKICQYDDQEDIPYGSDWDLFFWCNDFSSTMRGLLSDRDLSYFTLAFNGKHDPERRRKIYGRAMRILELFADDGNLHVAVQYEAVMDAAKIRHDAEVAAPAIAGRSCTYGSMEGRVETNGTDLFFRKKRSRKYVYRLTDTEILSISWQLSA